MLRVVYVVMKDVGRGLSFVLASIYARVNRVI